VQHTSDAVEVAQQVVDTLLHMLPTLADDTKEDAVLDALHALAPLDIITWMKLKKRLKAAVPALNLYALEAARRRNQGRDRARKRPMPAYDP